MAEIKPFSQLDQATTVASDDQILINVESNNTYTTSRISATQFGAGIGNFLTIPYYPNTGGDITGSVTIDAGPDTAVTALEVTDVSGFDAGYFVVKQSGKTIIRGNGGPWLDLGPVRSVDFAATGGDVAIQVENYSVPVFSVTDFGQTDIRGPVTVGHVNGGAGSPDLPGYLKLQAVNSVSSSDKALEITRGVNSVFDVDYEGSVNCSSRLTVRNVGDGVKLWLQNSDSANGDPGKAEINFGHVQGTGSIGYSDVANLYMNFEVNSREIMRLQDQSGNLHVGIGYTGTAAQATDRLTVDGDVNILGDCRAVTFTGDGSGLTNLNIPSALQFAGTTDVTGAAPTASQGDVWINLVAGNASASWTGIVGDPVATNQMVLYKGSEWVLGSVLDGSAFVALATNQTITGSKTFTEEVKLDSEPTLATSATTKKYVDDNVAARFTQEKTSTLAPGNAENHDFSEAGASGTFVTVENVNDVPAIITFYTSAAARTADAGRNPETTSPVRGDGVLMEVKFDSNQTDLVTPAVSYFVTDPTQPLTSTIRAIGTGNTASEIKIRLTGVRLEAST